MNKVKTNRQASRFLKFLFKVQNWVNPFKQFGKHYLDRGPFDASEIDRAHGKIQHKIHLKSGHIL